MNVKLTPSLEDYLEIIYKLEKKNTVARVSDISVYMDVKMSSVVGALKRLKEKELINYKKNNYISLTEDGAKIASGLYEKFNIVKDFLEKVLKLSSENAARQACRIEHCIDPETARRFCILTKKVEALDIDSEIVINDYDLVNNGCGKDSCSRRVKLSVLQN